MAETKEVRKVWAQNPHYDRCLKYVNLIVRASFGGTHSEGFEKIPKDGLVMLAPNHRAAMMDPLLILNGKRGPASFGARMDIFKNPKAADWLRFLRVLPIARIRDGLSAVSENEKFFAEMVECMEHGIPFGLFSEGTHRAQRGMMTVKKGIFRIAKQANEQTGKDVYVVPIGLDYEFFRWQNGRAYVRVGDPINVTQYFRDHSDLVEAKIYNGLCKELQGRIEGLIDRIPPRKQGFTIPRALLALVSLPVFLACGLLSILIWLPAEIIMANMRDKAWRHSVFYVMRLIFPIFAPFHKVAAMLLNFYRSLFSIKEKVVPFDSIVGKPAAK